MSKVDLHVHSIHSEHPSEWFLQRIGAAESYTDPIFVYNSAKARGMDFVTLTDHNRISGSILLKERFPSEVFTGVESTVYFPEDGCKIHCLVYGLSERQFEEIQLIRKDIYQFREFLIQENLAYSVAHATYNVNNKLTLAHIEKLLLLFDVFEGVNGGRNFLNNNTWIQCIQNLTPEIINDLRNKHKIEPLSNDPWVKGMTGGSDDHAGFFIGKSYAEADAKNTTEFLNKLRTKQTKGFGRHNDFKSLAFALYKIAYDFSQQKSTGKSNPIIQQFTKNLFEQRQISRPIDKIKTTVTKLQKKKVSSDPLKEKILDLYIIIDKNKNLDLDNKLDLIYEHIAEVIDDIFLNFVKKIMECVEIGDLFSLLREFGSILPSIFLALPFFSTLGHMHTGKPLLDQIDNTLNPCKTAPKKSRILWFTDTFVNSNDVCLTLQKIAQNAVDLDEDIQMVTSITDDKQLKKFKVVNLEGIYTFNLPNYEKYEMNVPSLLHAMERLSASDPTHIYISTPGPIGLLGLLMAKLLHVPSYGVYHTDFTMQYQAFDETSSAEEMIEFFIRWFYETSDKILVPTLAYKDILVKRGYNQHKFDLFPKGIDKNVYHYQKSTNVLKDNYHIEGDFNILYAGRISKDKNVEFMINLLINHSSNKVNLILAGDGPLLEGLKSTTEKYPNIHLLGEVNRSDLALLYSECDLFIFPSKTDTFGVVVLEALACGLPCVVTDVGGPQELVAEDKTGFICNIDDTNKWHDSIDKVIKKKNDNKEQYSEWRESISKATHEKYDWKTVVKAVCAFSSNF